MHIYAIRAGLTAHQDNGMIYLWGSGDTDEVGHTPSIAISLLPDEADKLRHALVMMLKALEQREPAKVAHVEHQR